MGNQECSVKPCDGDIYLRREWLFKMSLVVQLRWALKINHCICCGCLVRVDSLLHSSVFKAKSHIVWNLIKTVTQAARLLFLESHSCLGYGMEQSISTSQARLFKQEQQRTMDCARNERKKSPISNFSRDSFFLSGMPGPTFPASIWQMYSQASSYHWLTSQKHCRIKREFTEMLLKLSFLFPC